MILATDVNSAWRQLLQLALQVPERSSRNGHQRELIGQQVCIQSPDRCFLTNSHRKLSSTYAAAELLWYLSGSDDARMVAYAPSYDRFITMAGGGSIGRAYAHGAYGPRIMKSLRSVVEELERSPDSRRAVIPIYQHYDAAMLATDCPDIPCTLSLQFLSREGALHCVATMRSNDLWLGFPYDVWCFTAIQRIVADRLGLKYGYYYHNVGSLHLYSKHVVRASDALADRSLARPEEYDPLGPDLTSEKIMRACSLEEQLRSGAIERWSQLTSLIADYDLEWTLLEAALRCAAVQFLDPVPAAHHLEKFARRAKR